MQNSKQIDWKPASSLPLNDDYDVIVLGGGPAGCGAAIAAARDGARTCLVEATSCLGGNMTASLVTVWAPFGDEQTTVFGGLALDIMSECKQGMPHVQPDAWKWVPADPELLKRIYDRRMIEAGVDVLFDAQMVGVQMKSQREVDYVVIANKQGLVAYRAKTYIDTTGDGDLCAWAGNEYLQADVHENMELQPTTLCFLIANVDDYAIKHIKQLGSWSKDSPIYDIIASGRYPEIPDNHLCYTAIGPGVYTFNAGHVWDVDPAKPDTLAHGLMEGRKMADAYHRAFKEFFPEAFGNSFLVATAPRLGIRETRRIIGDYYLTLDDYLDRRKFADEIARNNYWIDIHTKKDEREKSTTDTDIVQTRYERYGIGENHGIPYRCLIPRDLDNVLMAGRCISMDQPTAGAVRTMPCCMCMGEAAGAAAAMMKQTGVTNPRQVNHEQLRARLLKYGAYLPEVDEAARTQ